MTCSYSKGRRRRAPFVREEFLRPALWRLARVCLLWLVEEVLKELPLIVAGAGVDQLPLRGLCSRAPRQVRPRRRLSRLRLLWVCLPELVSSFVVTVVVTT